MDAGAVYRPVAEMLPTKGLKDQVTPVFELLTTAAVKVCVCDVLRAALPGETDTLTAGVSVRLALADLVGSAALTAVTVTVWRAVTDGGAL